MMHPKQLLLHLMLRRPLNGIGPEIASSKTSRERFVICWINECCPNIETEAP
jgi:hypothetical protein